MNEWIDKDSYSTKLLANSVDLSSPNTQIELVLFKHGKYEHYHKQKTEFFYFTKGTGKAIIDGKEYKIALGSLFLIKPHMRHTWINESVEPMEAVMLKTDNHLRDTFEII